MFWDIRVPKQVRQTMPDKKQNDSENQMANYSDNNPFKHLEKMWKPFITVQQDAMIYCVLLYNKCA